jgi:hypothetical protein
MALLGKDGLIQAKVVPTVISGCRPVVLSGGPAEEWLQVVSGYCRGLGTTMNVTDARGFINGAAAGAQ